MNDKEFFDKYVMDNPLSFKNNIIAHCRTLDKYDVYELVVNDKLKIMNLQKENQKLKGSLQTYEILLKANVEENQQLKENNQAMQEELARTWAKLDKKEEIINKAKEFAKEHIFQFDGDKDFDALLEILDNKGE